MKEIRETKGGHFSASAPGKVTITGEHYVVYGSLAIVSAINKRTRVTISSTDKEPKIISHGVSSALFSNDGLFTVVKSAISKSFEEYGGPSSRRKIRVAIQSDIPFGSGLGSSAAVSVATSAAICGYLGEKLSKEKIWEIAHYAEKSVHGKPSGMDTSASLHGGLLVYSIAGGIKPIKIHRPFELIVVFSGKKRSTSRLVSKVSQKRKMFPNSFQHLTDAASILSLEVSRSLQKGDLAGAGLMMDMSQNSLFWSGASTRELDEILEELRRDSFGAKITGAGGGGSVIALPKPGRAKPLLQKVSANYKDSFLVKIPQEGLSWEKHDQ